jgi:predicted metal-dependent hydrolase
MAGENPVKPPPIPDENWRGSVSYCRGVRLFNAGYYWEAHEEWEGLWHAHGRRGPMADLLKGLIKLAAAGVKVRQGQKHGIVTHATRAAAAFESVRREGASSLAGFNLQTLIDLANRIAAEPPVCEASPGERVVQVFDFELQL